jgi:hypothetical protein
MSKFDFTKAEINYFIDKCMLNEELALILTWLNMGYSRIQVKMMLEEKKYYMSESTLDRKIKKIKKKIIKVI